MPGFGHTEYIHNLTYCTHAKQIWNLQSNGWRGLKKYSVTFFSLFVDIMAKGQGGGRCTCFFCVSNGYEGTCTLSRLVWERFGMECRVGVVGGRWWTEGHQGAWDTGDCTEVLSSQWSGRLSNTEPGAHLFIPFPQVPSLFTACRWAGWPGPSETHALPLIVFPTPVVGQRAQDTEEPLFSLLLGLSLWTELAQARPFWQRTMGPSSERLLTGM